MNPITITSTVALSTSTIGKTPALAVVLSSHARPVDVCHATYNFIEASYSGVGTACSRWMRGVEIFPNLIRIYMGAGSAWWILSEMDRIIRSAAKQLRDENTELFSIHTNTNKL